MSLGAVTEYGRPLSHPLMFDMVTEAEMKHTEVITIGVHKLVEFNDKQDPSKKAPLTGSFTHVYDLVTNFVKENGNSHFIIDECPITKPPGL